MIGEETMVRFGRDCVSGESWGLVAESCDTGELTEKGRSQRVPKAIYGIAIRIFTVDLTHFLI